MAANRFDDALASARWERRDAVYFAAVRERQQLKESLRDKELAEWRASRALTLANAELDQMRAAVRELSSKQQEQEEQLRQQRAQREAELAQLRSEEEERRQHASLLRAEHELNALRRRRQAEDAAQLEQHEADSPSSPPLSEMEQLQEVAHALDVHERRREFLAAAAPLAAAGAATWQHEPHEAWQHEPRGITQHEARGITQPTPATASKAAHAPPPQRASPRRVPPGPTAMAPLVVASSPMPMMPARDVWPSHVLEHLAAVQADAAAAREAAVEVHSDVVARALCGPLADAEDEASMLRTALDGLQARQRRLAVSLLAMHVKGRAERRISATKLEAAERRGAERLAGIYREAAYAEATTSCVLSELQLEEGCGRSAQVLEALEALLADTADAHRSLSVRADGWRQRAETGELAVEELTTLLEEREAAVAKAEQRLQDERRALVTAAREASMREHMAVADEVECMRSEAAARAEAHKTTLMQLEKAANAAAARAERAESALSVASRAYMEELGALEVQHRTTLEHAAAQTTQLKLEGEQAAAAGRALSDALAEVEATVVVLEDAMADVQRQQQVAEQSVLATRLQMRNGIGALEVRLATWPRGRAACKCSRWRPPPHRCGWPRGSAERSWPRSRRRRLLSRYNSGQGAPPSSRSSVRCSARLSPMPMRSQQQQSRRSRLSRLSWPPPIEAQFELRASSSASRSAWRRPQPRSQPSLRRRRRRRQPGTVRSGSCSRRSMRSIASSSRRSMRSNGCTRQSARCFAWPSWRRRRRRSAH
jgi:hypothetical protein